MSYRKHLMTRDESPSELYKATEVGTNLASLGTDAISRNALINKLEQWQKQDGYDNEAWNLLVDVITEIKNMPLATDIYVGTNDAISRQQAIDAVVAETIYTKEELKEYYEANSHRNEWVNGIYDAVEAIKQLPPIQPKRGKWIKTARWGRVYYCDQCRNYLDFDGVNVGRGSTNFCPNCGCRMDGGEQ